MNTRDLARRNPARSFVFRKRKNTESVGKKRKMCYTVYGKENCFLKATERKTHKVTNIIVAGSRAFEDYALVEQTLGAYIRDYENTAVISGTARGADRLGERFAKEHGMKLILCPADWDRYGRAAGYRRNEQMAILSKSNGDEGVLFAFWDGVSRGTGHMIDLARKHGLEVHIVRYDHR